MADKLKDFAGAFKNASGGAGGAPKGLGLGVKLLAGALAGAYGLQQSMFTGKERRQRGKNVPDDLGNRFK